MVFAAADKIQTVTGAMIDPHFRHAATHGLHVTGIAER
jgi:hypothetical protein